MDLLEKQTQCLQIQKEGDEKDGGRLQNSLFFTQYKTPQENKQTKLEKELRVTS